MRNSRQCTGRFVLFMLIVGVLIIPTMAETVTSQKVQSKTATVQRTSPKMQKMAKTAAKKLRDLQSKDSVQAYLREITKFDRVTLREFGVVVLAGCSTDNAYTQCLNAAGISATTINNCVDIDNMLADLSKAPGPMRECTKDYLCQFGVCRDNGPIRCYADCAESTTCKEAYAGFGTDDAFWTLGFIVPTTGCPDAWEYGWDIGLFDLLANDGFPIPDPGSDTTMAVTFLSCLIGGFDSSCD